MLCMCFLFYTDIKLTYTSLLVYHHECVCALAPSTLVCLLVYHISEVFIPLSSSAVFSLPAAQVHTLHLGKCLLFHYLIFP